MNHTPEPWRVYSQPSKTWPGTRSLHILAGDQTPAETAAAIVHVAGTNPDDEANAARIVACINACAGIEDPGKAIEQARTFIKSVLRDATLDCDHEISLRNALTALGGGQ